MINLMTDADKKQIQAAHTNVILLRLILLFAASALFIAMIFGFSYFILSTSKADLQKNIDNNNRPENNSYAAAVNDVSVANSKLSEAQVMLNEQIPYSKIITELANGLPSGVIIGSLSLSNANIGSPITISVYAKTAQDVNNIKTNFEKSTVFTNFQIGSITNDQKGGTSYPVSATIGVTINKENL